MIISPKYKFVFIATEKTGSTSIHQTLLNCVKDEDLVNNSTIALGDKHISCQQLLEQRPQCKNYFKFAFVRNPWDRVVSWYNFSMKIKNPNKGRNITGKDFLSFILEFQNIWGNEQQNQYNFTECCDFIGRFENLQDDFNTICDKIGILQQKLPYKNKTTHKHYSEYYDDETKQIVAEVFAKDIEYFGYEFGK